MSTGFAELEDGGHLAYQLHGEGHPGVPLLLIRPLGGYSALWGAFRDELARSFRVISFDLRGTGRSSADPGWVSTKGIAADALGLLDALAVERAHVFGISLGGMAATWLGLRAPSRVAKLCIACAPECGRELSHASVRAQISLAACFLHAEAEVEPALVKHVLSERFRSEQPRRVVEIERMVRERASSRRELIKHALAGFLHDARSELPRMACCTLVLAGEHDMFLGVERPYELAQAIPHARFSVVQDSGHDLTIEQPLVTARLLTEFLRAP